MNLNSQPDNLLRESVHNYALGDLRGRGKAFELLFSAEAPEAAEFGVSF